MDLESPMGMVMAGPNLADPDVLNKSVTSGAIELWKGKVSGAAKKAVEEVQEEVMDDDLLGVKGAGSQTARELSDVVARARSLTKKMGKVELGGEWAWSAKKKAEAQADAVAFMAAHEAVVADSYVDDDDRGLLNRKSEILYPFGHHNMHKEHGENIGYPGGNRPYYARDNQNEHVGQYLNANVGGPTHAYYESARRAGGEVIRPAAMQARLQSLDALWEGIPPDSDGTDEASKSVWIGAVSGQSPMKAQMMEHNLEHQFLLLAMGLLRWAPWQRALRLVLPVQPLLVLPTQMYGTHLGFHRQTVLSRLPQRHLQNLQQAPHIPRPARQGIVLLSRKLLLSRLPVRACAARPRYMRRRHQRRGVARSRLVFAMLAAIRN